MALYKRKETWWISISHNGQRILRSTGTTNKVEAQQYHDKLKAELWRLTKLDNKAVYSWREAVLRWLRESSHKRSIEDDKYHLRWLDMYLIFSCMKLVVMFLRMLRSRKKLLV